MQTTKQKVSYSTIDEYIALQPAHTKATLEQFRQTIKKAAPEAEETISYQMPAFKLHGMLVWFAAFKDHYALFPMAEAIDTFRAKLAPYALSKGTIRFPADKPLPLKLITEIVKYRVKQNLNGKLLKSAAKAGKRH